MSSDRVRATALKTVVTSAMLVKRAQGDVVGRLVMPSARADPYPVYARVREQAPLVPSMLGWFTARHEIADVVLRDYDRFGSAPVSGAPVPATWLSRTMDRLAADDPRAVRSGRRVESPTLFAEVPDPLGSESMIGMDPPDHTRIRRLVGRAFTPRATERIRARVTEVAADLLEHAPRDGFDLMSGYAGLLPVVVISELLGLPPADAARVKRWGDVLAGGLDVLSATPASEVAPALVDLGRYLTAHFERRRQQPGGLVVDALIAPGGLSERELLATGLLLLTAGFETTVNLIGNAVLALLRHPQQLELLREDPGLVPNTVEEVLRWEAPVQLTSRMVRVPAELAGRRLRPGTAVNIMIGGANRDPEAFADPDRFDVRRVNARDHLSFAGGVHHCLGASLARLEGEVALRTLLDRHPRFELAGTVRRGRGLILRGPRELPVRLQPS